MHRLTHWCNEFVHEDILTHIRLLLWWLQQFDELNVDVNLDTKDQAHFYQHQLKLADTWSRSTKR